MSAFSNEVLAEVTNFPATQPISAVSLPLPTGASTEAKQDTGNASLASIDSKLTNPLPVSFSSAAATPTVSRVTVGAVVAATLAAANSARQRVLLHNEVGTLFVKLGPSASATDYTYRMTANMSQEINFAQDAVITARKASGSSEVQVTELI